MLSRLVHLHSLKPARATALLASHSSFDSSAAAFVIQKKGSCLCRHSNHYHHHYHHHRPCHFQQQQQRVFKSTVATSQQKEEKQQESNNDVIADEQKVQTHTTTTRQDCRTTTTTAASTAAASTAAATTTTTTTSDDPSWWMMYGETPRTSVLMELTDRVGVLHDVLRFFWKYDVNVCRIESRPAQVSPWGKRKFDFFVDMEGSTSDANIAKLLDALKPMTDKLLVLDEKCVHWFPRHISELDLIANRTLDAGTELQADHPGFHDPIYRARRAVVAKTAVQHAWDQEIPRMEYTADENSVWSAVWNQMEHLWEQYACKEYLKSLQLMKDHCGYGRDGIPQPAVISEFLKRRTNFQLRPVAGLLSSRDFLNGLAFRVFFSTQYIRHHSKPLYTPEPDICHELLGHAPMFADRDFADFSQEIGLASLGASDEDVEKLARCYWHSVEFGLCLQDGKHKAYGAGLLSSFGELEYACSDEHPGADQPPTILPWDPEVASRQDFPITTYQPVYFLAESLQDAKQRMRRYCEDLPRPFFALHNAQTNTVHIDRPVRRTKGMPTGKTEA